jgi:hypothetical protein
MKIIFSSARIKSPSRVFYSTNLQSINGIKPSILLEDNPDPLLVDYSKYDVVLFMGYDPQALLAKQRNPGVLVGVIEPRATQRNTFDGVDFIIVNSLEAKDYFSQFNRNIFMYYAYPQVPPAQSCPTQKEKLVIGYHGNKIHLDETFPRITDAIELLNKEMPVEFWAMYNIKQLGKWEAPERKHLKFNVLHIQYEEENYARYMAHVDIGIVPQLIPVSENKILRYLIGSKDRRYQENETNYFLRFKDTTNIGRHLVFAQYGIPVVSDMTPSSCSFIADGVDGMIAYSTSGWHNALTKLAHDAVLRKEMGKNFFQKYLSVAAIDLMNKNLLCFLEKMMKDRSPLSDIA